MRVHAWVVLLGALSGCGLVLDVDPPDPVVGIDGGRRDGGPRGDGGPDGGEPSCRTDVDCDDGDACDGHERCIDARCVEGEPVVCFDDDVCDGSFSCDPSTGECSSEIAPPRCPRDENVCNGIESCDPVVGCVRTPALDCDDRIGCTEDACDPDRGCVHEPDPNRCDAAPGGVCVPGVGCEYPTCIEGITCVAENACQTASCVEGRCVRVPLACSPGEECCAGRCVPLGCDDRNPCTSDRCNAALGCESTPVAGSCEDGNLCTIGDRCEAGRCIAGGPRCTTSNPCLRALCAASTGSCSTVHADGALCSDGDACTSADRCLGGVCQPGARVVCDDAEPCTAERCDAVVGCFSTAVPDRTPCRTLMATGACFGGRCLACPVGFSDCNGDGTCECNGTCSAGGLCASVSACSMPCPPTAFCCSVASSPDFGRCIGPDTVCTGGTCCTSGAE